VHHVGNYCIVEQIIITSYSKLAIEKNSAQKGSLHCWLTLSVRIGQLFHACNHIMPWDLTKFTLWMC